MGWSANEVAMLSQLANNTEYKAIAAKIGRSTSAVCAKVKRLRDASLMELAPLRRPIKSIRNRKVRIVPEVTATNEAEVAGFSAAMARMTAEATARADDLVSLEDRAECGCCYVAGDPVKSSRVYCPDEAVPGQSYCATHMARMFNGVPVKPSLASRYTTPRRTRTMEFA